MTEVANVKSSDLVIYVFCRFFLFVLFLSPSFCTAPSVCRADGGRAVKEQWAIIALPPAPIAKTRNLFTKERRIVSKILSKARCNLSHATSLSELVRAWFGLALPCHAMLPVAARSRLHADAPIAL